MNRIFMMDLVLPITDPNFTSNIIPSSNLARISNYLNSKNWNIDSLEGHTAETVIKNAIEQQGYSVIYPEDSRNEGFDLLIEEKFFIDNDIPFVKDSDLSWVEDPTGFGVLQIKNVSSSTEITKHFLKNDGKYEMIPVLAPDGTFNSGMLEPYQSLIKGYSEVDGLSINTYDEVELLVADQLINWLLDIMDSLILELKFMNFRPRLVITMDSALMQV